jgi:tetratricopeptide (TPR) repeat protein
MLRDGAADLLAANPALIPALLATGVFVVLGGSEAGFAFTAWYPAALFLLGLLVVSLLALGRPLGLPRAVVVALALFAAYTAWTYLSITWASQQGPAWDGANRTAMYLVVLALFALWPFDARGATAVLGVLGLGIAGLGLVELLNANGADPPGASFIDVRFSEPAGYMNANAALWTTGMLPCLFLASRRSVPVPVRALALGGAGLLVGLALLAQSRGWVLALPLALVLFLVVCPGRVRLLAAIAAVGVAGLAISGPVLGVHDDYSPERFDAMLADATGAILLAAAALVAVGLVAALIDRRIEPGPAASRRIGLAAAALVAVALVAGVVGYAATEGSPIGKLGDAWEDFKEGGTGPQAGGSRFAPGATNRYDFWRVAWDAFGDEPLGGMGVEQFQEEYLRRGDSDEQPRYAHSFELGVLSQTGLIGAVLLFGSLAAALAAALRARAGPPAARAAAAAAVTLFGYWLLHASVDWLWEFAALCGPALAALAMAGALAPRPAATAPAPWPRPALALGALPMLVLAASFAFPWLSAREVERAGRDWGADPEAAFRRLDRAHDLNPLSARPALTAATIALRLDRLGLAERWFREALEREPNNDYALLELGAMASVQGNRETALRLLGRARRASPRDDEIAAALRRVRRGRLLNLQLLNQRILKSAVRRGTPAD